MPARLTWNARLDDLAAASLRARSASRVARTVRFGFGGATAALVAVITQLRTGNMMLALAAAATALALYLAASHTLQLWLLRRAWRARLAGAATMSVAIEPAGAGLLVREGSDEYVVPWPAVSGVRELRDGVRLEQAGGVLLDVPAAAFASAEHRRSWVADVALRMGAGGEENITNS